MTLHIDLIYTSCCIDLTSHVMRSVTMVLTLFKLSLLILLSVGLPGTWGEIKLAIGQEIPASYTVSTE